MRESGWSQAPRSSAERPRTSTAPAAVNRRATASSRGLHRCRLRPNASSRFACKVNNHGVRVTTGVVQETLA